MTYYQILCSRNIELQKHLSNGSKEHVLRSLQDYLFTLENTVPILRDIEDLLPEGFIKVWEFPRASRTYVSNIYSLYRNVLQKRAWQIGADCRISIQDYEMYHDILNDSCIKYDRRIHRSAVAGAKAISQWKNYTLYDVTSLAYLRKNDIDVHMKVWSKSSDKEKPLLKIEDTIFNYVYWSLNDWLCHTKIIDFAQNVLYQTLTKYEKELGFSIDRLFKDANDALVNRVFNNSELLIKEFSERTDLSSLGGPFLTSMGKPLLSGGITCSETKKRYLNKMLSEGGAHSSYLSLLIEHVGLSAKLCSKVREKILHVSVFNNPDANKVMQALFGDMNDEHVKHILIESMNIGLFDVLDPRILNIAKYKLGLPVNLTVIERFCLDNLFSQQDQCFAYLNYQYALHKEQLNDNHIQEQDEIHIVI